jgi:tetratricopeptide (TPR) repeat protein
VPEPTDPGRRELLAGRYRVDGLLGRGGMSEVYHGYDERLDRRVAIKMLRPSANAPAAPDSPEAVEILDDLERDRKRFLREIRVTAKLELPGIPAVYDTGIEDASDGPRLWLVMQLLRGSTLEALLDKMSFDFAPPPVAWAAAIGAQIAAVLADVHRVDIVHRDIKPANVMVVDGGLVKVLDFGIAILRGSGALPRLTQVDRTVGTPMYMSPEQSLGQAVTSASDIYSLGCLLLELLTGDPPFFATADLPLRAHHLTTPVPLARSRRPDVPAGLDSLVASMLAKDLAARPSAMEVYEALLPLTGRGTSVGEAGAGEAGAGEAGAGEAGVDSDRDPTYPFRWPLLAPPAVRREPGAGTRPRLTDAEAQLLADNAFALLDSDHPSHAVGLLEDGIARAGDDPALRLQLRHYLGIALFSAGEYTRASSLLDAAGREYLRFLQPSDRYVLDCAYHAGLAYAETGKPGKALPQLRFYVQNALGGAVTWSGDEERRILETRFVIAQLLATDGHPDEALAELQAVRPLLVEAFGQESTQVRNLDKQARRLSGWT